MQIETQVIFLLSIAALIAIFARRVRIPYTIAMVLVGAAASIFAAPLMNLPEVRLTPHLILVTFLPGLLFESAFHLNPSELRDNIKTISTLAVPGVILAASIVTLLVVTLIGLPLGVALLFGVLISATDPVAVLAIFKQLGVPKRLGIMVEGESLFNDGTALVLFEIVLAIVLGHQVFTVSGGITQFFIVVAGGIVLGLVAGLLFSQMLRRTEDPFIDLALTMVLAYGVFLLGEELGVSPVIAVVVAGMYVGNYAAGGGLSASTRLSLISFWAFLAFLINSAIFLLIGLSVELQLLVTNVVPVAIGILAMLVSRLVVIYPLGVIASWRSKRSLPLRWVHVLYWGGLRGSVSLALALSLPFELPQRDLLELMAFGAVFFSLVIQGLTMRPLLRLLNMTQPSELRLEFERLRARWAIQHAALHAIDRLHEGNVFSSLVRDRLRGTFEERTNENWSELQALTSQYPELLRSDVQMVQRSITEEQKVSLYDMLRSGTISDDVYYELTAEIDERIADVHADEWEIISAAIPEHAGAGDGHDHSSPEEG